MRFVKISAILPTAPDLSCVVIRKRHRENKDNEYCYAIIMSQYHNNVPAFWLIRYTSVCL